MNKPQSLNIFVSPNSDPNELGSVETMPLLRVLRPLSFALWFIAFVAQIMTIGVTGAPDPMTWLVIGLSTLLFIGVHLQFWYEESDQGRRFHHTVERMRGRLYEDDATGLPNSRHFVFELRRQMMRSVRNGRGFALVLTDVVSPPGTQPTTENLHATMGRNLRQALGDGDFVARLEGSIFACIVLDEADRGAAEKSEGLILALGAAIPLEQASMLHPIVSVTGYEGEVEVRDYLRRAQRDVQEARARATGPLYDDPGRVLGHVA